MTPYEIEFATVEEIALILDSWCAGQASQPHQLVDAELFKVEMRARVMRLIAAQKCAVARATEPDASGRREVLAWICYGWDKNVQSPIAHYLYVKGAHRRQGIARALLLNAAGVTGEASWFFTHTTPRAGKLASKRGGFFNPFLLDFAPGALK